MLRIEDLTAGYGKFQVLFDITAHIKKGKIVAIVGPNGSGKSTLVKTIMGLTQIYSGKIFFEGDDITKLATHLVTRRGITYLSQTENVFAELMLKENLTMASYILNKNESRERVKEVLNIFPILKKFMDKKCRFLSGGERQMAAMGMAMMRKPKIVLFDEPVASLAPKISIEILDKIKELRDRYGITVVLIEQAAKRALQLADNAILLINGRVAYEGDSKGLLTHPKLGKFYLGIKS
ncbi:MAG: ABC transporter ATP-binding protein [Asgard group archaeon]